MIGTRTWKGPTRSFPGLWIEVRRSVGLLAFPLLVVAGWSAISGGLPRIALWPETSAAIPNMVHLVGPLAGGLAAWMAGRESRTGMSDLLWSTPQSPTKRALMTMAGATFWSVLAYVAVVTGLVSWAHLHATWGGPYWSPMLVGLLAVVACSVLGFAAGWWVPNRFATPLVAVLLFVALVGLENRESAVKYLSPTSSTALHADVFFGLWPAVGLWRSLWLVGLIGVALAGIALRHDRGLLTWTSLIAGIAAGSVGSAALLQIDGDLARRPAPIPFEPVCVQRTIPICVHPAYRQMLPRAAEMIDGVVKPLEGVPDGPKRADQVLSMPQDFQMLPDHGMPFRLEEALHWDWGWQNIAENTVEVLLPHRPITAETSPDGPEQARDVVAGWLLQQAGLPRLDASGAVSGKGWDAFLSPQAKAAFARFAALEPEARHQWLVNHFQELREGRIAVKDLP